MPDKMLFLAAALCACLALSGCGRERVTAVYPSGKPKTIRTYGWFGDTSLARLQRERTFFFNNHPEVDAHYRKGLLHGDYVSYWHNGQKKSQGRYRRGMKEGVWEFYFNRFTLSSKGLYRDDAKEGPWNEFWENGTLKAQGSYRAGRETGTWKGWSAKGEQTLESSCFEANPRGVRKTLHGNQTPNEEYACSHGVPQGPYARRGPEGDTLERGVFDSLGRKEGVWETFHPGGARASLRRYHEGLERDSAWAWDERGRVKERGYFGPEGGESLDYDTLGRLVERRHFRAGKPEGESWTYFPQGAKRSLVVYRDGMPAEMKRWHDNGAVSSQGRFAGGKRDGEWTQSDEKGVTREVTRYAGGEMHGERVFYDAQGKLIRTLKYEHGYPAEGTVPADLARRAARGDTTLLREALQAMSARRRKAAGAGAPEDSAAGRAKQETHP